jgi:hypothetical protein
MSSLAIDDSLAITVNVKGDLLKTNIFDDLGRLTWSINLIPRFSWSCASLESVSTFPQLKPWYV